MNYFLVMIAYIFLDIAWAKYTLYVSRKEVVSASLWASIIPVFSSFMVLQYIGDVYMIIPMCIGSFIGTFVTLQFFEPR